MEVSSPLKLMADPTETNERNKGSEGEEIKRKVKTKAQFKKMAREKGKNKSPKVEVQLPVAGIKRVGKLIFEEGEESLQKRRCTISNTSYSKIEEGSAVAAR